MHTPWVTDRVRLQCIPFQHRGIQLCLKICIVDIYLFTVLGATGVKSKCWVGHHPGSSGGESVAWVFQWVGPCLVLALFYLSTFYICPIPPSWPCVHSSPSCPFRSTPMIQDKPLLSRWSLTLLIWGHLRQFLCRCLVAAFGLCWVLPPPSWFLVKHLLILGKGPGNLWL